MRVLLYHKQLTSLLGGGSFLPMMFIAELQRRGCEVTLAINRMPDLESSVSTSGVSIDLKNIKVVPIDPVEGYLSRNETLLAFYRHIALKRLAKDADVCISTANVFDFGKPAHHFMYLLSQFGGHAFYDHLMKVKSRTGVKVIYRKLSTAFGERIVKPLLGIRPLRKILSDPREKIYPNSLFVAGLLREYYGDFNSEVFYPPTTFEFPAASGAARDELLIIYIGRIFPPKRITEMISIVERARELSGKDLKFHIAGELTPSPYTDLLRRLAAERPWLELVGPKYGAEKEAFMLGATYALHAERDETFGIAITEYLKAGNIPVVPDEGGPKEIVDIPDLAFHTNEEAAKTLARLVADDAFRDATRRTCAERAKRFTIQAYIDRQKAVLDKILSK